jgi:hypothetical protein
LRLGRAARKQLAQLMAGATSLQGDFFRSVAFRYFHPDDVISVGEYPRMTYVLSVATQRNLDLAATLSSELANLVRLCLRGSGYDVSQQLAEIWISEGIDSVVFPSATGAGRNVAVYLANAAADSVLVRNRAEVLAALRQPRVGKRGR